jgi:adenosylcobyric acid synthase
MKARTVMIQGTASSVGKSLLVTGLCRLFRESGLRVAPFKSQNMALNASVTSSGGEIGRAQAVQAEAAGVVATVDMNPILLKPEGDARSQVVVLGRPLGSMSAREYHEKRPELGRLVEECLGRLRDEYDVVVIEGAGSPAEINLRDQDIVNMFVARLASAPVLLAGDIDRGGVFAALVGTIELLESDDRARIAGFVINKFRGDLELLKPGLDFLERRTGTPVLGVVPYVPKLRLPDEDSVSLESRSRRSPGGPQQIDVAVICLPRISNYDDVLALEHEPDVVVRFVDAREEVARADLVIVPGTKSTLADLAWLREHRLSEALLDRAKRGAPILGICGGCQLLGERIDDPHHVESRDAAGADGLGLLPVRTRFAERKRTAQVVARALGRGFLAEGVAYEVAVQGYEIHMGYVEATRRDVEPFEVVERNGERVSTLDGAVDASGNVVGTMIHGLLEDDVVRTALLGCASPLISGTDTCTGRFGGRATSRTRTSVLDREEPAFPACTRADRARSGVASRPSPRVSLRPPRRERRARPTPACRRRNASASRAAPRLRAWTGACPTLARGRRNKHALAAPRLGGPL